MPKTSTDLVESLAGMVEELREKATLETRQWVAEALKDQYVGADSDDILSALGSCSNLKGKGFAKLLAKFTESGVSDDFRMGILFAARMAGDPDNFEL